MLPARRTFVLLGFLALVLVCGALDPAWLWIGIGLDAVLLGAVLLDARRARSVVLTARRNWPEVLVQQAPSELGLQIELETPTVHGATRSSSAAISIEVRETLHPAIASTPFRARVALRRQRELSYTVVPSERGERLAGPLVARIRGPWALAWWQVTLLDSQTVRVYPRIRWPGRVGRLLALAQRNQLGAVSLDQRGAGGELYALRRYRSGDSRSRIHWKATARRGFLVTREDSWERGAPLLILLDCGRSMTTRHLGLSKLDHALAAALVLIRVAAGRGDHVRVLAVSDRIERQIQVAGGTSGLSLAHRQLYDLEARPSETLFDLATESVLKAALPRATVVVFTSISDLAAAELLLGSLRRLRSRHRPMLINLEDPAISKLARDRPETEEEAFAKLSSLEILLRNRGLSRQLQRGGIAAINASADQLALAALEGYFEILGGMTARSTAAAVAS